jgi:hypothetical protein
VSEEHIVRTIGVTKSSLPPLYRTSNKMRAGNQVVDQVTLDMCGAAFASEGLRVARHQVAYPSRDHRTSVSTETVAYRPGGTAMAMQELHHALAHCPTGWVSAGIQGVPPQKERLSPLPLSPRWEPGTIAVRLTETSRSGRSESGVLVYQTRGDLLSGTYVFGRGTGTNPGLVRLARRCATLMATELNKAPGVATNA